MKSRNGSHDNMALIGINITSAKAEYVDGFWSIDIMFADTRELSFSFREGEAPVMGMFTGWIGEGTPDIKEDSIVKFNLSQDEKTGTLYAKLRFENKRSIELWVPNVLIQG